MSDWREGTEVEFSVKGVVRQDGRVAIGCQSFTKSEVYDVASNLKVTEPKTKYQKGDVYVTPLNEPRWRGEDGRWLDASGFAQAQNDSSAEANMGHAGYRFLIVGGKVVA